jgi:hypothetical protein
MRFRSLLLVASLAVSGARADEVPTAAMMAPVRELAAFMSTLPPARHVAVFATHDVCIVENFAPFIFRGRRAVARWEAGFRLHADRLTGLTAVFDAAHDFSVAGNRAYFSLPTTWTGRDAGRHFEEHGVWAFVLERPDPKAHAEAWRILGYGWGVDSYTESP